MKDKLQQIAEFYRQRSGVKDAILYILIPGTLLFTPIFILIGSLMG